MAAVVAVAREALLLEPIPRLLLPAVELPAQPRVLVLRHRLQAEELPEPADAEERGLPVPQPEAADAGAACS